MWITNSAEIDECQCKKLGRSGGGPCYFFRIGLYPSPTRRVRIASASLMSANGPSCTRNSLSVAAAAATNAGYSFFLSASTNESASSCLLTAATCTKYPAPGRVVEGSAAAGGFDAGDALAGA